MLKDLWQIKFHKMKHIHTFESFLSESLNEAALKDFHPFLDGTDIDPSSIKQFYVEPKDIYIKINSGNDAKDMKDLTEVRNKIKKMIPGSAKVYLEPWYIGEWKGSKKKTPGSKYDYTALQFVYNMDVITPEFFVEFAHNFDPKMLQK